MKIDYVRDAKANYLRIEAGNVEDFQMRMIEENSIDELLHLQRKSLNGNNYYMYGISSMVCLDILFETRQIGLDSLMLIINSLKNTFKVLENYLLDLDGLILSPDMIYMSTDEKSLKFAYCVGEEQNFESSIKILFEYIIKRLNHRDTKAVTIAYGIYKRICDGNINVDDIFYFEEVEEPVHEIVEEKIEVKEVLPQIMEVEEEVEDRRKLYIFYGISGLYTVLFLVSFASIFFEQFRLGKKEQTTSIALCLILGGGGYFIYKWYMKNKNMLVQVEHIKEKIPYEKTNVRVVVPTMNYENIEIEEGRDEEGTVLLGNSKDVCHILRWEQNGDYKRFDIVSDTVVIGSATNKSDCVISMPGVSRMHAKISKVGDEYYIKDLNSTNGTSVNGRELACFEMCPIKQNDRIIVGNIECVFV